MSRFRVGIVVIGAAVVATLYFNCSQMEVLSSRLKPGAEAAVQNQDFTIGGTLATAIGSAMSSAGAGTCPTVLSTDSNCQVDATNSGAADLIFDNCNFQEGGAWNGILQVSLSSGAPVRCGSAPAIANNLLLRQFINAQNQLSSATMTTPQGTVTTIDDSSPLANFDQANLQLADNTHLGVNLQFDHEGNVDTLSLAEHITVVGPNQTPSYDHTIIGSAGITTSGGSRTIQQATFTVYHNLMNVIGTATVSNVVYIDSCCTPVSGTVTTVFSAGANVPPTTDGSSYLGQTETVLFNGCNNATVTDVYGNTSNFTPTCL
jgi:hypothetical protein